MSLSQVESSEHEHSSESSNPMDNMSLAEIVAQKYKKKVKVNHLKTPEEAAKVLIKDTKEFNVNEETYTEGSKEEQA